MPLVAGGCALAVALCLLWLAATSSAFLQEERERSYGEALAEQVAFSVTDPLQRGDLLSARASLQRFIDASLAGGVEIRDVEGMPMGTAGNPEQRGARRYSAEIRIGSDTAGEVIVSVDNREGLETRWRFLFSLPALAAALSLLVFLITRFLAQRISMRLTAIESSLALGDSASDSINELQRLEESVARLPLDMLRGHAEVPAAASSFREQTLLFVHLASLVRYVDTLGESNLHRYSRRLQQVVQASASCYRGEVSVVRPFGLLITFSPQPNAGSEALRAASCARLIALIAEGLKERTNLSIELSMTLGGSEDSTEETADLYPQLCAHGVIDELQHASMESATYPVIRFAVELLEDEQLAAALAPTPEVPEEGFAFLDTLNEEQESLLAHQAALIIERIKPATVG